MAKKGSQSSSHSSRSSSTRLRSSSSKPPRSTSTRSRKSSIPKKSTVAKRSSNGKIKLSASARADFMRRTGYPKGRKGYVVDHIVPLECGGADVPSNKQWQTVQEAKIKDRSERSADGSNGVSGTFNGLPLKNVIALKITGMTSGTTRNTLRVLGKASSELEQHFILKSCASVKVSIHEIRGRIMHYTREPEGVYEITIQARE